MAIKIVASVLLMLLTATCLAQAQQPQYYPPQTAAPAQSYGSPPAAPPYMAAPQGYAGQAPGLGQYQTNTGAYGTSQQEWPQYPYPPYHNPYYQPPSPRDAITGTIDWFFGLPSNIIDRVSNFLDGNFFPVAPATQGAPVQPQPQGQVSPQVQSAPAGQLPPAVSVPAQGQ